uniref:Uncharacterized protein n=1 Tax=Arion vulgaris TaxID=1028688 RepID=A0A0B6ZXD9_9EUPU
MELQKTSTTKLDRNMFSFAYTFKYEFGVIGTINSGVMVCDLVLIKILLYHPVLTLGTDYNTIVW